MDELARRISMVAINYHDGRWDSPRGDSKKAFAQKDIMIPFLNGILGADTIVDIDYRNVEQLGFDAEDAKVYYDIYCHCSDGKDFIVEMQRRTQKYYRERMVFYSTYPIQNQYEEAKRRHREAFSPNQAHPFLFNYRLHPVYIISITDFKLDHTSDWPEDKFVSRYNIREVSNGEPYCDTLNYIFIELPRFRKALEQKSDVAEKWAFVFNNIAQLNAIPTELSENCFQRLFESAKIANFTPDERVNYLENQKMRFDYENVMEYAKEQARDEGLAEGRAEGKREMAKNLLKENVPVDFICRVTGLSQEEIQGL